ncbi:hypothetical protein BH11MYX4_BH11MYX4_42930 [soil metagenome]
MRFLTVVAASSIVVSVMALAACATPRPGGGELVVYANGEANSMRIEGDRAWGPAAELRRFDDAYRGTLQGHVVDLHFTEDRVHGMVGSSRLDLYVSTVDGKVHGQGLVNGHISTFDVDADAIEGSFGSCSYQMKRKGPESDDYLGYRSCSGSTYPTSRVSIPDYIRALPAMEQATIYALLLAG